MVKRSSVSYLDRLYSVLTYLLPMAAVVSVMAYGQRLMIFGFADFLVEQFKPLVYALLPFWYVDKILSTRIIDFISVRFVAWFCVFIFVVRNYKVNHFVRFNAMQALLLDIIVALVSAIVQVLSLTLGNFAFFPFMLQIIASVTFLGITAAFIYSTFQCVLGKYAEMPIVSEVAYSQVR